MFGWNLDTYRHVIQHHVPFNDATFLLPGQLMKDWPEGFADVAKQGFPSPLRDKYHVILAIPTGMGQALRGVRHGVLLRCALIKPPEENSTPGSLKAVHVSLVKPVAYLKNRVNNNGQS